MDPGKRVEKGSECCNIIRRNSVSQGKICLLWVDKRETNIPFLKGIICHVHSVIAKFPKKPRAVFTVAQR